MADKLYIKVTPEFDEKFTRWAKELGFTKSQFGNLCLRSGLNHIVQAISPMDAITPAQLAEIARSASERSGDTLGEIANKIKRERHE
jgi:hypothetical protein